MSNDLGGSDTWLSKGAGEVSSGQMTIDAYRQVLNLIITSGVPPGSRIDPGQLADTFGCSVTPVRDALHILVGERLIEIRTGEGFYVPAIGKQDLVELYNWNLDLLLSMIGHVEMLTDVSTPSQAELTQGSAALFSALAYAVKSGVPAMAMRWVNARLSPVRLAETRVLDDTQDEILEMAAAIRSNDKSTMRRLVRSYHIRRVRHADKIADEVNRSNLVNNNTLNL